MTVSMFQPIGDVADEQAVMTTPSVSGDAFRQALSRLAAGVSIVTMVDQEGQWLGLTATAVTSVSLDPPLILVCIDNRARTAAALRAGSSFVAHLLAAGQEALARQFAGRAGDKFAGVVCRDTLSGCPRLEGVLASLECELYQIYPAGDHTIFVGRVVDIMVDDADAAPLVYFRSQFVQLQGA